VWCAGRPRVILCPEAAGGRTGLDRRKDGPLPLSLGKGRAGRNGPLAAQAHKSPPSGQPEYLKRETAFCR